MFSVECRQVRILAFYATEVVNTKGKLLSPSKQLSRGASNMNMAGLKGTSLALLFVILLSCASAKIIANFVMPHGGIALDPGHFNTTNSTAMIEAWEIHNACVKVGQQIHLLKPDLIFLSTPHGVADLTNFIFYLNPVGKGSAETDNCQCPPCCYNVSVKVDTQLSSDIVKKMGVEKNVSGLAAFGPPGQSPEPFPLRSVRSSYTV